MQTIIKIIIISTLLFNFSCSSKKTEHTVTTTETVQGEDAENAPVTKKTVVKEEKEDSGGDFGILGTTVSLVGEIIALPFRLVAGIIDFIF